MTMTDVNSAKNAKNFTLGIQKMIVAVSGLQTAFLAFSYLQGSLNNKFPVLESLFSATAAAQYTESGCWQSMMPFLASTYISITIFSILALVFRPGKELRMMMGGLSSVHCVMAIVRLELGPTDLYQEGAALSASSFQFAMTAALLLAAALPYRRLAV